MSGASLLRPFIEIDSPGTQDGQPIYFVTYHFEVDEQDILWCGPSYATALAVARQWREDDGVLVFDRIGGLH